MTERRPRSGLTAVSSYNLYEQGAVRSPPQGAAPAGQTAGLGPPLLRRDV